MHERWTELVHLFTLKGAVMTNDRPIDQAIAWEHDWETAQHRARNERRLLLVDVEKDH